MKPRNNDLTQSAMTGQSRKYRVRIRTKSSEFEGLFFSPYPERRLSEVMTRMEDFINLKEVKDLTTGEAFPFMVISKPSIETIKVLEEWG